MKFGIGQPMRRHEDLRLITGRGRYTDDVILPRMTHAFVLRSPVAHAHIKRIDAAAAGRMPGVLFVATGEDVDGAGPNRTVTNSAGRHSRQVPAHRSETRRIRKLEAPYLGRRNDLPLDKTQPCYCGLTGGIEE
jgi:CO/xanthine dehydrogenase Mo-binding subunit